MRSTLLLAAALIVLLPSAAARATVVTEPPDLSNSVATPTAITLTNGSNSVSGTLETPGDRQDNFTVTVPAGHRLTAASVRITGGGFVGSVTFNLSEVRTTSGAFTMGLPMPAGTYYVQVVTDFSTGTTWSMSFNVQPVGAPPVCGDGAIDPGEACDDGNDTECDGCSATCVVVPNGCRIDGVCVAEGAAAPTNGCAACLTARSRTAYSPVSLGTGCDDGAFCTDGDACDGAGNCVGHAHICDDGDTCTTDACNDDLDMCTTAPIAGCGVDAGMDAGAIEDDAGSPSDAAVSADASLAVDAASSGADSGSGADAGRGDSGALLTDAALGVDAGAGTPSSGCGCRAADRRSSGAWGLLAAIGLMLAVRKRRAA